MLFWRPLDQATTDDVITYLNDHNRSPATRKSILTALRTFYGWATASERLDRDPTLLVHPIRQHHTLPTPTPVLGIQKALATSCEEVRLMVMLGYRSGLRLSEIASLHSDNVTDLGLAITGKGTRQRLVPIHRDLRPMLRFTGWAFPSPVKPGRHVHPDYVADRVQNATGHTTHGLRHRFATDAYTATGDIRGLAMLLGHSNIQTTSQYVAVAEGRLSRIVNALH